MKRIKLSVIIMVVMAAVMMFALIGCSSNGKEAEEVIVDVDVVDEDIKPAENVNEDADTSNTVDESETAVDAAVADNTQSDINSAYDSFADVIESIENAIGYNSYSNLQKEYCRGDFFEIDGRNALVLLYYVSGGAALTPGFYSGLWVEKSDGNITCLTDQMVEEAGDPDDAYVSVNIRKIDEDMYLNLCVRTVDDNTDRWKNQYYRIGSELVLEYDLQAEESVVSIEDGLIWHDDSEGVYYLNQEQIDESIFFSTQDHLDLGTGILSLCVSNDSGLPEGYTFDELLDLLADRYTDELSEINERPKQ